MQTDKAPSQILIFDIGKTNKKILILDEDYKIVFEQTAVLEEKLDEDGFLGEDIQSLTTWMLENTNKLIQDARFSIKAMNYSAYGASFVLITKDNKLGPLYNYLKPLSIEIKNQFFSIYGQSNKVSIDTCSPSLGNLNSGLQLYRIKYEKPEFFTRIKTALHLPQYLSYIFTKTLTTELTSLGCHTMLWNFNKSDYQDWVDKEKIKSLFPPMVPAQTVHQVTLNGQSIISGIGLHDSSSALIPYLKLRKDPFILLSTGTWCIALNPFTKSPLTEPELLHDCLCYLSFEGKPVKASRLFLGQEHQDQTKKLASHFGIRDDFYKSINYDSSFLFTNSSLIFTDSSGLIKSGFEKRNLTEFRDITEAYHALIHDLVITQIASIHLISSETIAMDLLVDGGFAQNEIFMNMLAINLTKSKVFSAEIPQASAIGAAMIIHPHWNTKPLDENLIKLKYYPKNLTIH